MTLLDTARAWLAEDPDPATAAELSALIDRAEAGDTDAADELADAFDGTLQFGTAGLAWPTGPGQQPDEPDRGGARGGRTGGVSRAQTAAPLS